MSTASLHYKLWLAQHDPDYPPLTTKEAAEYLGRSARWMHEPSSDRPDFTFVGGERRYLVEDLDAQLPGGREDYFTVVEAAKELGRCRRTLDEWRKTNKGPHFVNDGGRVLYQKDSTIAWAISHHLKK